MVACCCIAEPPPSATELENELAHEEEILERYRVTDPSASSSPSKKHINPKWRDKLSRDASPVSTHGKSHASHKSKGVLRRAAGKLKHIFQYRKRRAKRRRELMAQRSNVSEKECEGHHLKETTNTNLPCHYIYLNPLTTAICEQGGHRNRLEFVALGELDNLRLQRQSMRREHRRAVWDSMQPDCTPLMLMYGACPSSFAPNSQVVLFVLQKKEGFEEPVIDFWWVKPLFEAEHKQEVVVSEEPPTDDDEDEDAEDCEDGASDDNSLPRKVSRSKSPRGPAMTDGVQNQSNPPSAMDNVILKLDEEDLFDFAALFDEDDFRSVKSENSFRSSMRKDSRKMTLESNNLNTSFGDSESRWSPETGKSFGKTMSSPGGNKRKSGHRGSMKGVNSVHEVMSKRKTITVHTDLDMRYLQKNQGGPRKNTMGAMSRGGAEALAKLFTGEALKHSRLSIQRMPSFRRKSRSSTTFSDKSNGSGFAKALFNPGAPVSLDLQVNNSSGYDSSTRWKFGIDKDLKRAFVYDYEMSVRYFVVAFWQESWSAGVFGANYLEGRMIDP